MKRIIVLILTVAMVLCFAACSADSEEEAYESDGIPTYILDDVLSNIKYNVGGPFSMTIGELVNSAMPDYQIQYLTGEEAIAQGYADSSLENEADINNVYCAIISGNTTPNPYMPNIATYQKEAVVSIMIFNDNNQLLDHNTKICQDLEKCIMVLVSYS